MTEKTEYKTSIIEETEYKTSKDGIFSKRVVRGLAALVAGSVIIGNLGGCYLPPYRHGQSHRPAHHHNHPESPNHR